MVVERIFNRFTTVEHLEFFEFLVCQGRV